MRVLDEAGEHVGVMKTEEALKLAMEKGIDLIEVTAEADPPVVRIISFDKFRYQKEKEVKRQRQEQKAKDLKHMRITPRMAENDLKVKAKKIAQFLEKGHRVELGLFLKGREKAHKDWGIKKLEEFIEMIEIPVEKVSSLKSSGRGFSIQITKK